MEKLTDIKLPISLVIVIVGQAMGLAVWINSLQDQAAGAQAVAAAAEVRVEELTERLTESEVGLAVLNDQSQMIVAEHGQIGDSLRAIWDELDKRSPAPVPAGTDRSYGY
jgi:hypothetical protein